MLMIQKTNFSYVLKDESVTVFRTQNTPNRQYISFNCYQLQSRRKFYKFKDTIQNSGPEEYNDINDIYGLARRFELKATNGHNPISVIDGKIAF